MQDHLKTHRRARQRGGVILVVFACMFVLLTLVAGLHYRQSSARATLLHEEANLEARIAAEYEMARWVHPDAKYAPLSQAVSAKLQHAAALDVPDDVARHLFSEGNLPDLSLAQPLSFDAKLQGRPGLAWNEVQPTSKDPALQPDKAQYIGVVSDYFPYAAYAPQGSVEAEEAFAWRKQGFEKPLFPAEKAYSGGAIRIAALRDIKLKNCPYGELYSREGKIEVDAGLVSAFRGVPPNMAEFGTIYTSRLATEIQAAREKLSSSAQDKTQLCNGQEFSADLVWSLLRGDAKALNSTLSLRQAMRCPFLVVPGGEMLGIVINLWFHVPNPPDQSALTEQMKSTQSQFIGKIEQLTKKIEETAARIDALTAKLQQPLDEADKAATEAELNSLKSLRGQLQAELEDIGQKLATQVKALFPSDTPADLGPQSRAGDVEAGGTNEGIEGWAYGPLFNKIWSLLKSMVPPNFDGLHKLFINEARLVHFGAQSYATDFQVSSEDVHFTATFNVPTGRSLRLNSNLTIRGDLWLQRGSTLVVDRDLRVLSPLSAPSDDPRVPQGKIYLEEGANLVVGGDLSCQGTAKVGSVLVGAPYHKVHPVMGAILVDGNIDIPYAILPAFSLSDVDGKIPSLKTFYGILSNVAPNLAKIDGPFHPRKPFFAKYATTFQIWIVPTPLGPVLVPTCIPYPTPKNINNPIFRALTLIYSTQMNLAWGENFVTHTDWWFLGQQVVPMYPKVEPGGVLEKLAQLEWPVLPSQEKVTQLLTDKGKDFATEMVSQLVGSVITKMVSQQFGLVAGMIGDFVSAILPLEEWFARLAQVDAIQAPLDELGSLTGLKNAVQNKLGNLESYAMLHETPGLFVYAGQNLSVACGSGPAPPLTVGMLVARKDIRSNAKMTVGAALSFEGNIRCRNLLYDPTVTQCSLYVPRNAPRATPTGVPWLDWALESSYGGAFSSDEAVHIGPAVPHLTVQGWKH